ncbi:uncharacterized protein B0I36DRAFT_430414 [Microdochium trichocladiopsis]|uniref:Uncharacterized protein n=1 Tax=Microdochium trichocladiopsis TaxID=1682393 RepID=A0A9P9BRV5_9PEZI|nr:uncharacterized protein B0I36DRAFT_430414 [Microdochium trichocladiopsis]KAH7033118.1 hypothetical protein B0I36DRAFT_430414 [Microdochium trichocladiopsis]
MGTLRYHFNALRHSPAEATTHDTGQPARHPRLVGAGWPTGAAASGTWKAAGGRCRSRHGVADFETRLQPGAANHRAGHAGECGFKTPDSGPERIAARRALDGGLAHFQGADAFPDMHFQHTVAFRCRFSTFSISSDTTPVLFGLAAQSSAISAIQILP